jgi:hypothetical protein
MGKPEKVCVLLPLTVSPGFLMVQQPLFTPDSGTEADHFAVGADDPMTGDDNRDIVSVIGIAHGAKCPWASDGPGDISV